MKWFSNQYYHLQSSCHCQCKSPNTLLWSYQSLFWKNNIKLIRWMSHPSSLLWHLSSPHHISGPNQLFSQIEQHILPQHSLYIPAKILYVNKNLLFLNKSFNICRKFTIPMKHILFEFITSFPRWKMLSKCLLCEQIHATSPCFTWRKKFPSLHSRALYFYFSHVTCDIM